MRLIQIEIIKNWPPSGDKDWPPQLVDGAVNLDDISLVEDIGDVYNLSKPVVLIVLRDNIFIRCLGSTKEVFEWDHLLQIPNESSQVG